MDILCHIIVKIRIMEENFLNNKRLKENPFTVPKGYFFNLQEDFSNRTLGEARLIKKTIKHPNFLRPFITAAASVCVAVFGVAAYLHYINMNAQQPDVINTQTLNSHSEEVADYIMIENEDIYDYMSEL